MFDIRDASLRRKKNSFLPFLEFPFWEFIFYKFGLSTNTAIEPSSEFLNSEILAFLE